MANKRINSISLLRFISMLLIVICHFFQYYGHKLAFYFNVGVQIFFVISGYLYSRKRIDDPIGFLKKTSSRILVPYWAFLLPIIAVYHIALSEGELSFVLVLKALVCADTLPGLGHLWFVGYILFCYFITPYLYWFSDKMKRDTVVLAATKVFVLAAVLVVLGELFDSHFDMLNVCCYIIGYFIGVFHCRYGTGVIRFVGVAGGLASIMLYAVRIYYDFFASRTGHFAWFVFSCSRLGSNVIFSIAIVSVFLLFDHVKHGALLRFSDKYSYYIYIVHLLFILSPFSLMELTAHTCLNWIFVIAATCSCSVILCRGSGLVYRLLEK